MARNTLRAVIQDDSFFTHPDDIEAKNMYLKIEKLFPKLYSSNLSQMTEEEIRNEIKRADIDTVKDSQLFVFKFSL